MIYNQTTKKNKYTRPSEARNYLQFSHVAAGAEKDMVESMVAVPAIVKLRPENFYNHYAEATSEGVTASGRVVCSGSPVYVLNAAGAISGIAIMKEDAEAGANVSAVTKGLVWLPISSAESIDGVTDPLTLNSILAGGPAYWDIDVGGVTTTAASNVHIGTFANAAEASAQYNDTFPGKKALVHLDQLEETAVAVPGDAPFTSFTESIGVYSQITDFANTLVQNVTVYPFSNDPNTEIRPEHVTIVYSGTTYTVDAGYTAAVTFSAGLAEAFDVDVTIGGATTTQSYTVDISATTGTANFTAV